ncbi:DNA mismatch repair protein MLH3 [Pleurostoma richardsiae]|uniref:DNA mismatch repair protein MLH3 n=1 Tax=Pleurostoma richardsiae TaxID=41990 RepID=A0AA38RVW3_9PEZI|nr:DNA mismatch repair protein MLH3 [Pleurostoma richardsiae]
MSIKPLPGDVAAQIKSSVVITSLNSVVCGLIKNSLDAEATKINVSVDYSRGNCAVEDNGIGILPSEFQEDGGLGQLYYTSKYPHRPDIYGKQGAFLASVAALSLLSVASHHRSYSSHNSMSIHRSRILARHMPALAEHRVLTFPHGTRITVRDLFGSMPLVLDAVAVLLAWPHSVSISFRDANGIQALRLRTGGAVKDGGDDWVTIGASAPLLSIAGCVSLTPVATKRVQFVSLGIEPIPNRAGSNVLYEEVNKIFADSSFGSVEAESDSDEFGEQRILEGFTQRELKAKKGVDRWPMFSLVIDLDIHKKDLDVDDLLDDRQQSLSIIVDLLRAMFYQFLKKHHFSPKAVKLLNVSGPQDLSNTTISDVTLSKTVTSILVDTCGRTGFVLQSGAASDLEVSKGQTPQPDSKRQGRQEEASERSEWVQNLLSKWKNPAFDLTEPPIPRLPDVSETLGSGIGPAGHQCPASGAVFINAIDEASSTAQSGRLTKENLGKAEVIAQVDNKFVLARVPSKLVRGGAAADSDSSLFLVLIDQHAADERCRVEALMEDYFAIDASDGGDRWTAVTEALEKPLQFELAAREYDLLTRARPHFEKWGIVYDVQIATASVSQPQARRVAKLAVRKLPPAIFERCRLDPKLLVELIRKEMWRINDDPSLRAMVEIDAGSRCGTGEVGGPHPWVSRIYGCPPGILDLINSRACRGAIMFNDPLTMDECAKLLERLRATAFPFQCAHGRPSMVPMLDVGTSMGNSEGKLPQELPDGAFIRQFKQWRSAL